MKEWDGVKNILSAKLYGMYWFLLVDVTFTQAVWIFLFAWLIHVYLIKRDEFLKIIDHAHMDFGSSGVEDSLLQPHRGNFQ